MNSLSDALDPLRPCRFAAPLRGRPALHEGITGITTKRLTQPHQPYIYTNQQTGNPSEF